MITTVKGRGTIPFHEGPSNPLGLLLLLFPFTDGETEAQRGTQLARGGGGANSGSLALTLTFDHYAIPPPGRKALGSVSDFFLFVLFAVLCCTITCFFHLTLLVYNFISIP